jgi:hypothetical protein
VPQPCTICRHPKRLEIEQALVSGTSLRQIAGQYGTAKSIVARHRSHVADVIAQQTQAREAIRTGTLLQDVRAGEGRAERLYGQAEEILASALKDKDRRTALQAIRTAIDVMGEARGYLELRGALTGELSRDRTQTEFSIQIVSPRPGDADQTPRVSFASQETIELQEGIAEIALRPS